MVLFSRSDKDKSDLRPIGAKVFSSFPAFLAPYSTQPSGCGSVADHCTGDSADFNLQGTTVWVHTAQIYQTQRKNFVVHRKQSRNKSVSTTELVWLGLSFWTARSILALVNSAHVIVILVDIFLVSLPPLPVARGRFERIRISKPRSPPN